MQQSLFSSLLFKYLPYLIRRGFAEWNMPNRTATQKAQADATNAAAYDR